MLKSCCSHLNLRCPKTELRHLRPPCHHAELVPSHHHTIYRASQASNIQPHLRVMSFSTRIPRSLPSRVLRCHFSTAPLRRQASIIPYTQTCPSPTCECASTPPDLDIDRKTPLLNTMAAYSEQVIICTGKEDWTSNIENEEGATGEFVKGLKSVIGKGGIGFDVGWFSPFSHKSPYQQY